MTSSGFNKQGARHNEPIRPIFDTEIKRSTFQSINDRDQREILSQENQYENQSRGGQYNRAYTEEIPGKIDRVSENVSRQTN